MNLQKLLVACNEWLQDCEATIDLLNGEVQSFQSCTQLLDTAALLSEYRFYKFDTPEAMAKLQNPSPEFIASMKRLANVTLAEINEHIEFVQSLIPHLNRLISLVGTSDADLQIQILVDKLYVLVEFHRRMWTLKNNQKAITKLGLVPFNFTNMLDFVSPLKESIKPFASDLGLLYAANAFLFERCGYKSKIELDAVRKILNLSTSKAKQGDESVTKDFEKCFAMLKRLEKIQSEVAFEAIRNFLQDGYNSFQATLESTFRSFQSAKFECTSTLPEAKFTDFLEFVSHVEIMHLHKLKALGHESVLDCYRKPLKIAYDKLVEMCVVFEKIKHDLDLVQYNATLKSNAEKKAKADAALEIRRQEETKLAQEQERLAKESRAKLKEQEAERLRARELKRQQQIQREMDLRTRAQALYSKNTANLASAMLFIYTDKPLTSEQKTIFTAILKESCAARYTYNTLEKFVTSLGVKMDSAAGGSHHTVKYKGLTGKIWEPHGTMDNTVPQACVDFVVNALFRLQIIRGDKEAARGNKNQIRLFEARIGSNEEINLTPFEGVEVKPAAKVRAKPN